jgi:Ion channel
MTEPLPAAVESTPKQARGIEDRYGILLVTILGALILMGAVAQRQVSSAVNILVMGGIFFLALWISAVSRRLIRIATVSVPIIIALSSLAGASSADYAAGGAAVGTTLLAIGCVIAIIHRVASHDRISMNTVLAALCIYLLAAIVFALIYRIIALLTGLPFFAQTDDPTNIDYIYFSFVCITTLGFGDLSPATDLGKMAAVVEAVIGQIYLVTVVALFIANLGRKRIRDMH